MPETGFETIKIPKDKPHIPYKAEAMGVTEFPYREYDGGNLTYYEEYNEDGYRCWRKMNYDSYGNMIYKLQSDEYWVKQEFDENSNLIHRVNSWHDWKRWEYDHMNNVIESRFSNANHKDVFIYKYDERGNLVFILDATVNMWARYRFNEDNEIIFYEDHKNNWWDKDVINTICPFDITNPYKPELVTETYNP